MITESLEKNSLYTFDEEVGPGLPLWLPNGAVMDELENLAKETERAAGLIECVLRI